MSFMEIIYFKGGEVTLISSTLSSSSSIICCILDAKESEAKVGIDAKRFPTGRKAFKGKVSLNKLDYSL